jgi:hypothetical protein
MAAHARPAPRTPRGAPGRPAAGRLTRALVGLTAGTALTVLAAPATAAVTPTRRCSHLGHSHARCSHPRYPHARYPYPGSAHSDRTDAESADALPDRRGDQRPGHSRRAVPDRCRVLDRIQMPKAVMSNRAHPISRCRRVRSARPGKKATEASPKTHGMLFTYNTDEPDYKSLMEKP